MYELKEPRELQEPREPRELRELWQPQDPSVRTESLFSNLRQFHSKFCDVSSEVFTPRSSLRFREMHSEFS